MHELTRRIKEKALELGYARVGIAPAARYPELLEELGQRDGYERWKGDTSPFPTMADPFSVMPEAKSIISLVWSYGAVDYPETLLRHVARTYLSRSYCPPRDTSHGIRLTEFEDYLEAQGLRIVRAMNNMQTADRLTPARAGVVTFGRNNFAYAGDCGSFITLVSILTDAELECDQPTVKRQCPDGCRLCADACPTKAIDEHGRLIAERCVLYNNILPTAALDAEVRPGLGQRIHGCDECQVACPRNREILSAPKQADELLDEIAEDFDLERILFLEQDYYERVLRPIMFNYINDLDLFRRNAAIAMGNSGELRYLPALEEAAQQGTPTVSEAALWAIGQIQERAAASPATRDA